MEETDQNDPSYSQIPGTMNRFLIVLPGPMEFCVFLINSLAEATGTPVAAVYQKLSGKRDILDRYIHGCYDVLHSLGKEYLVSDLSEMMEEEP